MGRRKGRWVMVDRGSGGIKEGAIVRLKGWGRGHGEVEMGWKQCRGYEVWGGVGRWGRGKETAAGGEIPKENKSEAFLASKQASSMNQVFYQKGDFPPLPPPFILRSLLIFLLQLLLPRLHIRVIRNPWLAATSSVWPDWARAGGEWLCHRPRRRLSFVALEGPWIPCSAGDNGRGAFGMSGGRGGTGGPREGIGNRRMWMFFFWLCGESEQTEMPLREQEQRQTRARMYIDVFTRSPRTHDNVIIVILLLLLFIIFQHCK